MNGRAILSAATILFVFFMTAEPCAQEEEAGNPSPSDSPALSLKDLDALMEESDEDLSAVVEPQIFDLLLLSALLSLALLSFFQKSRKLKYLILVFSVVYLGFWKSSLFSVVNIFGLFDWSFPPFKYSIFWYVFMLFMVITTMLWGRLYCGRICAFGALTQLLAKVLGSLPKLELPASIERRAIYLKYILLAFAIAYFLVTNNNFVYRYIEPFWMFSLSGSTTMWVMLALLLLVTVFIRNFYCRYLCPAGAALGLLSNLAIFRIKRCNECRTCKICEKSCEWNAIQGPKILTAECARCDDCERHYKNENKCPHWLLLKRGLAVERPGVSVSMDA